MITCGPTLATLFEALTIDRDDHAEAIIRAFATCTSRRGGSGDTLLACARLLARFHPEEIGHYIAPDEPDALKAYCGAFAAAMADAGSRSCTLNVKDLADSLLARRFFGFWRHSGDSELSLWTEGDNGTVPSLVRSTALEALRDCSARAARGITEIEARLFTALTGLSVHVVGGIIAEPFTPEELIAAGFSSDDAAPEPASDPLVVS